MARESVLKALGFIDQGFPAFAVVIDVDIDGMTADFAVNDQLLGFAVFDGDHDIEFLPAKRALDFDFIHRQALGFAFDLPAVVSAQDKTKSDDGQIVVVRSCDIVFADDLNSGSKT